MSRVDLAGTGPVTVPTTFVWSDGDVAVGETAAQACAAKVTGDYRFVALSGVTHWIPDEAPAALADAVLSRIGWQ
jgi:pimeloyl-ACP methyl ester carboxylesterase